jgi:hypothetical protein
MRSFVIVILIGSVWICCRPKNAAFNPFDKEFKFHKNFNFSDYDSVTGECGYWNLTNRNDGTYYQFYIDEKDIVAKGFKIDFDQIIVKNPDTTDDYRIHLERIYSYPVDSNLVRKSLSNLNIKKVQFVYDSSSFPSIEIIDLNDSIHYTSLSWYYSVNEHFNELKIVRQIDYFNGKGY